MGKYNTDELGSRLIDSLFGKKTYEQKRYEIKDDAVYYCEYLLDENQENPIKLKEEVYLRRDVLEGALRKWGLMRQLYETKSNIHRARWQLWTCPWANI